MKETRMKSGIYEGELYHERLTPKKHAFSYRVFMVYFSLKELDSMLSKSFFWSKSFFALARFKREDFLGDPQTPLDQAIREKVYIESGIRVDGDIRILANFRYFGFNMNPLITYYCFDCNEKLVAVVAEVNNTPWNERHAYVLPVTTSASFFKCSFSKTFTVSPFNTLDMRYQWRSNIPDEKILIEIHTQHEDKDVLNAYLTLNRKEISGTALNFILIRYPLQTMKVIGAIYWEALRLWLKGIPFKGKNKFQKVQYAESVNENN